MYQSASDRLAHNLGFFIFHNSSFKSCKIIYNLSLTLNQINPKYPINNYIIATMSSQQESYQTQTH